MHCCFPRQGVCWVKRTVQLAAVIGAQEHHLVTVVGMLHLVEPGVFFAVVECCVLQSQRAAEIANVIAVVGVDVAVVVVVAAADVAGAVAVAVGEVVIVVVVVVVIVVVAGAVVTLLVMVGCCEIDGLLA